MPLIADIADCNYTFVIGENPNPEGKYSANFIIRDTTDTKFYAPGESVVVPDAGADFLGWANVATGKVEDVTNLTMGDSNITYKAIYTTDTFDVTVDFDGGNVDGETSKSFKAAYGTTVDLTGITPLRLATSSRVGTPPPPPLTISTASPLRQFGRQPCIPLTL